MGPRSAADVRAPCRCRCPTHASRSTCRRQPLRFALPVGRRASIATATAQAQETCPTRAPPGPQAHADALSQIQSRSQNEKPTQSPSRRTSYLLLMLTRSSTRSLPPLRPLSLIPHRLRLRTRPDRTGKPEGVRGGVERGRGRRGAACIGQHEEWVGGRGRAHQVGIPVEALSRSRRSRYPRSAWALIVRLSWRERERDRDR